MSNHYWADLHLGHSLVAGLRGFASPDEHDNHIIGRWMEAVHKNDSIWLLGDLSVGNPGQALEIIRHLPGRKHLILGNHDNAHPAHRDAHRHQARYRDVFASVSTMAHRRIAGHEFLLSHFPYDGDSITRDGVDRYSQYRLRFEGRWLVHGHVHDEFLIRGRQLNVGVDKWMDGPAKETDLLSLMASADEVRRESAVEATRIRSFHG